MRDPAGAPNSAASDSAVSASTSKLHGAQNISTTADAGSAENSSAVDHVLDLPAQQPAGKSLSKVVILPPPRISYSAAQGTSHGASAASAGGAASFLGSFFKKKPPQHHDLPTYSLPPVRTSLPPAIGSRTQQQQQQGEEEEPLRKCSQQLSVATQPVTGVHHGNPSTHAHASGHSKGLMDPNARPGTQSGDWEASHVALVCGEFIMTPGQPAPAPWEQRRAFLSDLRTGLDCTALPPIRVTKGDDLESHRSINGHHGQSSGLVMGGEGEREGEVSGCLVDWNGMGGGECGGFRESSVAPSLTPRCPTSPIPSGPSSKCGRHE